VELWAYLESERFLHPVMREFYKERDVVYEERRLGESQPFGRLFEQFAATAYLLIPTGSRRGLAVGSRIVLRDRRRKLLPQIYVPANMILTLVGDVKPGEVLPIVEKYFGRLPARPKPEPLRTVEPPQNAERIVILHEASQPIFIEGYHKGGARDKDDAVYDAMQDLMSNGRTSSCSGRWCGTKRSRRLPAASTDIRAPSTQPIRLLRNLDAGTHTRRIRDAIHAEIERVRNEDISDDELQMIKARAKADLIRRLGDNRALLFSSGPLSRFMAIGEVSFEMWMI